LTLPVHDYEDSIIAPAARAKFLGENLTSSTGVRFVARVARRSGLQRGRESARESMTEKDRGKESETYQGPFSLSAFELFESFI